MNNIVSTFFETATRQKDACCYRYKKDGRWQKLTWNDVVIIVSRVAAQLKSIGVKHGDTVAILSATKVEWAVADLAILSCGAITVPIYPTLPKERVEHIIKDANVRFIFVENELLKKVMDDLSLPLKIIQIDNFSLEPKHQDTQRSEVQINEDDVASIIYTSGTTGVPKGVVLTHKNMVAEINATSQRFRFKSDDVGLMCLPLSHVLGRLMEFHHLAGGYELAFIESLEKFAENLMEVRPRFIVGVPRMIEKMYEKLMKHIEGSSWFKKHLFNWAVSIGKEMGALNYRRMPAPFLLRLKHFIASIFVYKKIGSRLGGRLSLFISGGAPLAGELAKFFQAIGLLILEGYGLTETFAAATVNEPNDYHFGTVGKPVPGVEVKIAHDGEILIRGPTVFREYLNMPEETKAAKTADGWFKTGDIGELSRDGFFRITDRKKDIIVTSGGENVAPQMLETVLMESPFINYCLVYGDRKKYLTALITLNPEAVYDYAKKVGIAADFKTLASHPKIRELIASIIEDQNSRLARHETIKKFAILDHDFSVEAGELTPTLKVCRKVAIEKYKPLLEELYVA